MLTTADGVTDGKAQMVKAFVTVALVAEVT